MVTLEEARARLAELCRQAQDGEDVVLTSDGRPLARLQPMEPAPAPKGKRPLGLYRGKVIVHDNFNDPLPDEYMEPFD